MAKSQKERTAAFQSDFKKARKTGKRVKKETVGGVTHETWEQPDGRRWIFAYYTKPTYSKPTYAENAVANSAEKAETPE